jgi:protein arginine kinase activator
VLCEECKKNPATVHLTQVCNGQKIENHFCEECASQKNGFIFDPSHKFSVSNLLGSMFGSNYGMQDVSSISQSSKCPNCGTRFIDIKQLGKLGCSECYQVYVQGLDSSLRRIHGNSQHSGKIPIRGGEKVLIKKQIELLKSKLQEAIKEEKYEEAAEIRDSVKAMEDKLSS